MSEILIAGAGETGMRLATLAAGGGREVVALRRRALPMPPGIRAHRADLVAGDGVAGLPRECAALVFCAAPDERSEAAYRALYLDGLRRLLDHGTFGRVLLVSSTAVYAEDAGGWVDEDTPADATVFNGRVLIEAERELASHPMACVLRPTGIYGPGRARLWRRARDSLPGRRQWTNRIHVDDVASALWHLVGLATLPRLLCASDDSPALEHEVLDGLRQRLGLPTAGALPGVETGKRVRNAALRATGWVPRHPDWRSGYASPPVEDL